MSQSDPSEFFLPEPQPVLSQGDIVLSPSVVLWQEHQYSIEFVVPAAPQLGASVSAPVWDPYAEGEGSAPYVTHEARWSPVMILSHSCELDKEFNRKAADLIKDGVPKEEAERVASADDSLDRYVVVAPLLPYSELPEEQHAGVRNGHRIGYFPVAAHPLLEEETFVHLSRACTVDRLLLTRTEQIASLSHSALGVLRFKLAECFTARDLTVIAALQEMVGQIIDDVVVLPKSRKLTSLQLYLHSGDVIHLEVRTPAETLFEELRRISPWRE